ncbi:NAD(P)/FAD-dependent oxidoreductase [Telmatospirillum sp. J64-1]|uniref:flavin-containing monooxygenase n=1 Tax=Telmatospirillum sp. J64-1 TaxID=2502183 RepID=UPI00115F1E54|nr:NAD(P)-binding domain-containing protein [Telmatospirillum sp. J64-1]
MTAILHMPPHLVAVIGAGPAGLVTARWLSAQGFEPIVFESSSGLGGQWNAFSPLSATWRGMRTNTSRVMTAFSDLDHAPGTPVYPRQEDMLAYLEAYATQFKLTGRIRFRTRVERLEKAEGGYLVTSRRDGELSLERFARVVVATGRYIAPSLPEIPGCNGFTGVLGASHTAHYDGASVYRDHDVLVAGCSISALEIASDLAVSGARSVTACYRRQRYILPKLMAGVPTDHVMFTRAAALAGEVLPPDALASGLKAKVTAVAGTPDQFGALRPDENIFTAGISQAQAFLPLVAEGRISVRPWIERIEGRTVRFADGTAGEFDAILFGTGYRLSLPFLSGEIAQCLGLDETHIDLSDHTFHPDLEGLAFIGLYDLVGPAYPVLELQARWIAYAWAGFVEMPGRQALQERLAAAHARRSGPATVTMQDMALLFARKANVEPDRNRWPELERALLFGPLSPASFRLEGPDSLPDASARTAAAAEAFGAIRSPELAQEERALRDLLSHPAPRAA